MKCENSFVSHTHFKTPLERDDEGHLGFYSLSFFLDQKSSDSFVFFALLSSLRFFFVSVFFKFVFSVTFRISIGIMLGTYISLGEKKFGKPTMNRRINK